MKIHKILLFSAIVSGAAYGDEATENNQTPPPASEQVKRDTNNDTDKTEKNKKSAMQQILDLENAFVEAKKAELLSDNASALKKNKSIKSSSEFLDDFIALADSPEADVVERASDWLFHSVKKASKADTIRILEKLIKVKPLSAYAAMDNQSIFLSIDSKQWLAHILAEAESDHLKAYAMLFNADILNRIQEKMPTLKDPNIFVEMPELATLLQSSKDHDFDAEIEFLLNKVITDYPDFIAPGNSTIGETARFKKRLHRNFSIGRTPPDIKGEDMTGAKFKLSDYRGKIIMLSFWATW